MEEVENDTSNKTDASVKGLLLVVGAYIVTLGLAICTISFVIMTLNSSNCSSVTRAMLVLWIIIAAIFITSVVVVRNVARKVIPDRGKRLAAMALHVIALLATYFVIAFALLVIFNC